MLLINGAFIFFIWLSVLKVDPIESAQSQEKCFVTCFDELGCVNTTKDWFNATVRPVNLEPLERYAIRTQFLLLTPSDNNVIVYEEITLRKQSVNISQYKSDFDTKILIHDFTSNGYTGWIKHLALAFYKSNHQCNVISIDWETGAEPPLDQAVANARLVALEGVALIEMLGKCCNLQPKNIHLIGHGLGAHIAGYIGKSFKGISRITGLDPTGPRFEGMPPVVRLDVDDADYVEVIHTDAYEAKSQGMKRAIGHVDFYPNNAELQPCCNYTSSVPKLVDVDRCNLRQGQILPGCSHKRVFKYYIESILDNECEFLGFQCKSYEKFQRGDCVSCERSQYSLGCVPIGLYSSPMGDNKKELSNVKLYLDTAGYQPYCLSIYKIVISLGTNPKARIKLNGYFEAVFVSEEGENANLTFNNGRERQVVEHGCMQTFMAYTKVKHLDHIREVRLKWIHDPDPLCLLCNNNLYVNNMTITNIRSPYSTRPSSTNELCSFNRTIEVKSGYFAKFEVCMEHLCHNRPQGKRNSKKEYSEFDGDY